MAADDFAGSFVYLAGGPSVESCDSASNSYQLGSSLYICQLISVITCNLISFVSSLLSIPKHIFKNLDWVPYS